MLPLPAAGGFQSKPGMGQPGQGMGQQGQFGQPGGMPQQQGQFGQQGGMQQGMGGGPGGHALSPMCTSKMLCSVTWPAAGHLQGASGAGAQVRITLPAV